MESKQYVVALEISSSKIVGVVGEPNTNGGVNVVDIEAERGVDCVKYGCVQNVEETKLRINRVISRLESHIAPKKITGVFVGISGRSVRNYEMQFSTSFDEESMITENVIESLRKRFYSEAEVQGDILDVIPCQYFIDNNETLNPIGTYGSSIKVVFNGIIAKSTLKMNIRRSLESQQYDIKGYVITPLAVAEQVLSNEERQLGCMLVDFGAETTTVSIYRGGVLHYLVTLPMGSRLITRDLTNLNMLEDAAEEIKKTTGKAMASESGRSILIEGIQSSEVQNYVISRSEEIVANINEQISYSGIPREHIAAGIVLVGGGALLNGFGRLVEQMTKLKVRNGGLPPRIRLYSQAAGGTEYTEVISILAHAASTISVNDSCVKDPVAVTEEVVVPPVEEEEKKDEKVSEEEVEKPEGKKISNTESHGSNKFLRFYQNFKKRTTELLEGADDSFDDDDNSARDNRE